MFMDYNKYCLVAVTDLVDPIYCVDEFHMAMKPYRTVQQNVVTQLYLQTDVLGHYSLTMLPCSCEVLLCTQQNVNKCLVVSVSANSEPVQLNYCINGRPVP